MMLRVNSIITLQSPLEHKYGLKVDGGDSPHELEWASTTLALFSHLQLPFLLFHLHLRSSLQLYLYLLRQVHIHQTLSIPLLVLTSILLCLKLNHLRLPLLLLLISIPVLVCLHLQGLTLTSIHIHPPLHFFLHRILFSHTQSFIIFKHTHTYAMHVSQHHNHAPTRVFFLSI
ncbi:hypothetical protein EmuJ_000405100 [Echinococcus multilocularis]|uniref:Uncharacterized protein n=1 Tax=Echinococcus multilocularis TaxID=6211 RepID=A0A068XX73_ECHMU|nr:hypothetical protein EmuJ_000405100 [Echinococcus multilocularis]